MSARKAISKRVRYAVLERDGYRCRYCGAGARDAALHVDHRMPVSKGGTDEFWNLVTACANCNLGKHAFLPVYVIPDQRATAFGAIVFGRACEWFGAQALTWHSFCLIQDLCYAVDRPELFLVILRDAESWAAAQRAMCALAGLPLEEWTPE